MNKHKLVIIYLPNGTTAKYCTKNLGDNTYQLADSIECDPNEVKVAYKEDDGIVGMAYCGMPYSLEMF